MKKINTSIKYPFTDYGIKVKTELLKINKTQNWLIGELKKQTDMFVDSSILNKLLTGRVNSKKLIDATNHILHIETEGNSDE